MGNEAVIERLYEGLRTLDGDRMASCYTPGARFRDPVFGDLTGEQVGGMWRMLTAGSTGVEVEVTEIAFEGDAGSARWVAHYTFTATGRPVVNRALARFRTVDGLIDEHIDDFSFHAWAAQALGWTGRLFGWLPAFRNKLQARARRNLDRFLAG
jgi:hypothetical protein